MISNLAIANFRNFDSNAQIIGPLSKVNLFIGRNNSGKSNVLRYIRDIFPEITGNNAGRNIKLPLISTPNFNDNEDVRYVACPADESYFSERVGEDAGSLKEILAQSKYYRHNEDVFLFKIINNGHGRYVPEISSSFQIEKRNNELLYRVWRQMRNMNGGSADLWYK